MNKNVIKNIRRERRKKGIRKNLLGTDTCPRLSVYRSLNHIYAQVINDLTGQTIVSASTVSEKLSSAGNVQAAKTVGQALAEKAKSAGVTRVAFDRNGFRYHGRIKALADAARESGLEF